MTPAEYLKNVLRTAGNPLPPRDRLLLGILGLAGETGEVVDLVKKELFHAKPRDNLKILNELGDVLWYFTLCLHVFGFTYEQVAEANVNKLRKRFPEGFSPEAAAARRDEVEPLSPNPRIKEG